MVQEGERDRRGERVWGRRGKEKKGEEGEKEKRRRREDKKERGEEKEKRNETGGRPKKNSLRMAEKHSRWRSTKAGAGFALQRTVILDNRGLWGKLLSVGERHKTLAMGDGVFSRPF